MIVPHGIETYMQILTVQVAQDHIDHIAKAKKPILGLVELICVKGGVMPDHWGGEKVDHFTGRRGFGLKDLRGRLERRPATRFAGRV